MFLFARIKRGKPFAHKKPRRARGRAGCKRVLNGAITREKSGNISC
nr:MAG TPA: hypothetical protein [Caudoviricetes sp.]